MLDSASSLVMPHPLPPPSAPRHHDAILTPLTILTSLGKGGKQLVDVELSAALPLSIATTRCPSTASSSTSSPRDCPSAYADLFSPPSAAGPLSPLQLPSSYAGEASKRATSAACRSLHFDDGWLARTTRGLEETARPPASAVLPKASSKRHNRRDKAKRRSRSAQRHPHSQQQQHEEEPPCTDDSHSPAAPSPAGHITYSMAQPGTVSSWEQLYRAEVVSSDDESDGRMVTGGGLVERVDISRAFVFSDLY